MRTGRGRDEGGMKRRHIKSTQEVVHAHLI